MGIPKILINLQMSGSYHCVVCVLCSWAALVGSINNPLKTVHYARAGPPNVCESYGRLKKTTAAGNPISWMADNYKLCGGRFEIGCDKRVSVFHHTSDPMFVLERALTTTGTAIYWDGDEFDPMHLLDIMKERGVIIGTIRHVSAYYYIKDRPQHSGLKQPYMHSDITPFHGAGKNRTLMG